MTLKVAMAQIDMLVGDVKQNTQTVIDSAIKARDSGNARVIVFPELCLLGYPGDGLLLKPSLEQLIESALCDILEQVSGIYLVLGYPRYVDGVLFNCAGVLFNGVLLAEYNKQKLSNVQGLDDRCYFEAGNEALVIDLDGIRVGLSIGLDILHKGPAALSKEAGAQVIFNLNASPFHIETMHNKDVVLYKRATENSVPILCVNTVGGQDERVYEGGSLALTSKGAKAYQAPWYEKGLHYVDFTCHSGFDHMGEEAYLVEPIVDKISPNLSVESHLYQALVLGLSDYVKKNHFEGVILTLREGLESSLALVIAVDALGAEKVNLVVYPDTFKSQDALDKLLRLAANLGVKDHNVELSHIMEALKCSLPTSCNLDHENEMKLEARVRTLSLMTIAHDLALLPISTTHKSDFFVGFSCLFGDMSAGFALLKDIYMSQVIILCLYRNSLSPVIPVTAIHDGIMKKDAFSQFGIDGLTGYTALDKILLLYKEQNMDADSIVLQTKLDPKMVAQVIRLTDLNEYKRRQAPLGIGVSAATFDLKARYPVSNAWCD
jgi:NAD+ synthase (glutamine-hydrolysing)